MIGSGTSGRRGSPVKGLIICFLSLLVQFIDDSLLSLSLKGANQSIRVLSFVFSFLPILNLSMCLYGRQQLQRQSFVDMRLEMIIINVIFWIDMIRPTCIKTRW